VIVQIFLVILYIGAVISTGVLMYLHNRKWPEVFASSTVIALVLGFLWLLHY